MDTIILMKLVGIVVLIIGNAFFVGAEIALTSARRSRIQQLADSGDESAKMVQLLHAEPERFYSVTQIGITLMSLALGAIGVLTITEILEPGIDMVTVALESLLPPNSAHVVAHTTAQVFAFTIISALHIVGGELAPKVYAFHKPESISLAVARSVNLLYRILLPFIWFLNHASNSLLRLLGQSDPSGPGGGHFSISEEELRTILLSSETHGVIDSSESAMIRSVIDLDTLSAKDVMVPRTKITGIPKDASLRDAIRLFHQEKHHRYPVYDATIDQIVGLLPIWEILANIDLDSKQDKLGVAVGEIMHPIMVIPRAKSLTILLQEFKSKRQQMALVIDEFGGTAGLVTLEDVLEEIVGEYNDEFTQESKINRKGPGGKIIFDAQSPLADLRAQFDVDIPPGDYTTLAGAVIHCLTDVPGVGDKVELGEYRLRVEKLDGHKITQVSIEILEVEEDTDLAGDDLTPKN